MSSVGYRLASGALWSLGGAIISRALTLLASIIVARMLGKVGFGEFGIIQSTLGMFGTFAGFGMGLTATKYVAEFRIKDPARAGRIIQLSEVVAWGSGIIMALLMALVAPWIAEHTLAAPHLTRPLSISALFILLSAITGAQSGALAGFEAFKQIAQISLISGLASFPLLVLGVWQFGVEGGIWGLIMCQAIGSLLTFIGVRNRAHQAQVPLGRLGSGWEWRVLWRFSFPSLVSGVMVAPTTWICNTMLINQPDGFAQMGLLDAANQWLNALLFLPTILGQVALPVLSERHAEHDLSDMRQVLSLSIKFNMIITGPLVLAGSLASPYIMALYGPGFAEAWPTLIIVLVTAALVAIQAPVGQIIAATGRMWIGSAMNLGWAVCFLLFSFLLVQWGCLGLAAARMAAYMVHAVWTFLFAISLLKTPI